MQNVSGHRRRLVRRTVQRLVQLFHFAWSRRLSPENWCLSAENGVFSICGAILGCFWRFWGAKPALFLIFCGHVTPPRGRWGFWATPHLLNVRGQGARHLVAGTLDPLVRRTCYFVE